MSHGSLTVPPTKPLVDFMTGPATRVVLMSKKECILISFPWLRLVIWKQVNTNNSFAILWWNSIWKLGGKKLVHEKRSLWGNAEDCQQKSHALQIAPFPYRMSAMSSISSFSSSIIRARIFLFLYLGQEYFFFHIQGNNTSSSMFRARIFIFHIQGKNEVGGFIIHCLAVYFHITLLTCLSFS